MIFVQLQQLLAARVWQLPMANGPIDITAADVETRRVRRAPFADHLPLLAAVA